VAENILGQVREKQRSLTPELVSLVLQTVDVVKLVLANIEERGEEGEDVYQDLRRRLDEAYNFRSGEGAAIPVAATAGITEVESAGGLRHRRGRRCDRSRRELRND
jgi:two-component system chemotaxis sensor kinase CheA